MANSTTDLPSRSLPIGTVVDGRYEITGLLGQGGFATVFRARHVHIGSEVALKILDLKLGKTEKEFVERFIREAQIASRIKHPNVVNIYDFGFAGSQDRPYIAMELLVGHELSDEIQERGPLTPKRALKLFLPALEALQQGHELGIVHKDLKPANLYITNPESPQEILKILDFGVARIDAADMAKLTGTGEILGTPNYLAPEYIQQQIVTPALDVYQMALILAEAISGERAVSGNPYTAVMLHCSGQLQIPEVLKRGAIGDIFNRALSINHLQRYPNAGAFAAGLKSVASSFNALSPIANHVMAAAAVVTGNFPADNTTPSAFRPDYYGESDGPTEDNAVVKAAASQTPSARMPVRPLAAHIPLPEPPVEKPNRLPLLLAVGALLVLALCIAAFFLLSGGEAPPVKEAQAAKAAEVVAKPIAPLEKVVDKPKKKEEMTFESVSTSVEVQTIPPGAQVYIDFEEAGTTPYTVEVLPGEEVRLSIMLEGYDLFEVTLDESSKPLVIDLVPSPPDQPPAELKPPVANKRPPKVKQPTTEPEKDDGSMSGYSIAP